MVMSKREMRITIDSLIFDNNVLVMKNRELENTREIAFKEYKELQTENRILKENKIIHVNTSLKITELNEFSEYTLNEIRSILNDYYSNNKEVK